MIDDVVILRGALLALLGDIDYRKGACALTEQVGACLNPMTLKLCDEVLDATAIPEGSEH